MEKLEVNIVRLEPMRVACINGFGEHPEDLAWEKMVAWAKAKGLLTDGKPHRIFGFNNPNPSPGSPKYGYDFWITVDQNVQPEPGVTIKDFQGGLYAVTRCYAKQDGTNIERDWKRLVTWMEGSRYRHGRHQWLEEHISPSPSEEKKADFVLDLYLPIIG